MDGSEHVLGLPERVLRCPNDDEGAVHVILPACEVARVARREAAHEVRDVPLADFYNNGVNGPVQDRRNEGVRTETRPLGECNGIGRLVAVAQGQPRKQVSARLQQRCRGDFFRVAQFCSVYEKACRK